MVPLPWQELFLVPNVLLAASLALLLGYIVACITNARPAVHAGGAWLFWSNNWMLGVSFLATIMMLDNGADILCEDCTRRRYMTCYHLEQRMRTVCMIPFGVACGYFLLRAMSAWLLGMWACLTHAAHIVGGGLLYIFNLVAWPALLLCGALVVLLLLWKYLWATLRWCAETAISVYVHLSCTYSTILQECHRLAAQKEEQKAVDERLADLELVNRALKRQVDEEGGKNRKLKQEMEKMTQQQAEALRKLAADDRSLKNQIRDEMHKNMKLKQEIERMTLQQAEELRKLAADDKLAQLECVNQLLRKKMNDEAEKYKALKREVEKMTQQGLQQAEELSSLKGRAGALAFRHGEYAILKRIERALEVTEYQDKGISTFFTLALVQQLKARDNLTTLRNIEMVFLPRDDSGCRTRSETTKRAKVLYLSIHPDKHPSASEAEKEMYTEVAKVINAMNFH